MSSTESLSVMIIEFIRSPAEFRRALLEDPSLAECREQVVAAGYDIELDTGTKVFLQSEHILPTLQHLRSRGVLLNGLSMFLGDLRRRHVIVSEPYISAVRAVLDALPKRLNVKEKFCCSFQVHVSSVIGSQTSLRSIVQMFAHTLPPHQ